MTDDIFDPLPGVPPSDGRPALPEPHRRRWQPLRLGLVELFLYDSEEFWFRDGHLLLRGNNGTGKSKVLSLTLPLLLDAQLRPSRVEPDGDGGKKMAWNLLMGTYPRRVGYAWIEFGRMDDDGTPRYLTLGAGLSAVAARAQVDSWFFMLEHSAAGDGPGGPRIGRDVWLTSEQRVVLTRDKLREMVDGRGQLFESATAYRRAVDERLFHLGTRRYDALMDTLIQLRQPQLSKKPDEAGLSNALTEALPPLPQELLADVAQALNQLEEDRRQLAELKGLSKAVERFDTRYRVYAGMLSRRQARELRQAQTDFDSASQERNRAQAELQASLEAEAQAEQVLGQAERQLAAARTRQETLQSDPVNQDANRLEAAETDARRRAGAVQADEAENEQARKRWEREQQGSRRAGEQAAQAEHALQDGRTQGAELASAAGLAVPFDGNPIAALAPRALAELDAAAFNRAPSALSEAVAERRAALALLRRHHAALQQADNTLAQRQEAQRERQAELEQSAHRRSSADASFEQAGQDLVDAWADYGPRLVQLQLADAALLDQLADWVRLTDPGADNPARLALQLAQQQASVRHANRQVALDTQRAALQAEQTTHEAEQTALADGRDTAPPVPHTRAADSRVQRDGAPLWQLVDFRDRADDMQRAGIEAALEAAGLLDAWVTPGGELIVSQDGQSPWLDAQWASRPAAKGPTLADWLVVDLPAASAVQAETVSHLLASVVCIEAKSNVVTGAGDADPQGNAKGRVAGNDANGDGNTRVAGNDANGDGNTRVAGNDANGDGNTRVAGNDANSDGNTRGAGNDRKHVSKADVAAIDANGNDEAGAAGTDTKGDAESAMTGLEADIDAETWVATDGRYRIGTLTGAWHKPQAVYIGHAARALARRQRLDAIALRLGELQRALDDCSVQAEQLAADRRQAGQEWHQAPSDQALRQALVETAASAREVQLARDRLEQAETLCREAEATRHAAFERLRLDAADLHLPSTADALDQVEISLHAFSDAQHRLVQSARDWRQAEQDRAAQTTREQEAQALWNDRAERLAASRLEAEEAQARLEVLRETVGAQVDDLRRQLQEARQAVLIADKAQRSAVEERRKAGEARAGARAHADTAETILSDKTGARTAAVARLQHFAASSLLSSALPALELPDNRSPWTIDPALTLARRIEQALAQLVDDDASWSRVQRQLTEDLQELHRALSALGHQAPAEPSDWGLVVHIIVHNRPERPDQLLLRLADDIDQRSALLSAKESELLENYLQAEIAAEVQRLLRAAETQVQAINKELHKRPTSTGVRYRLQWQPLGEDEGAPAGLAAARHHLLNTSADLWSADDRRVVGTMLQLRISAERERTDADPARLGSDGGGGTVDQLARALDYRRWHRFRVERLQDGQWRKLSGPASSGERALGLTVPLFAAIASFYSQGSNPLAPRLMLLDEAFAGIDDAARAHCMGLIREFDLDFVITSEREWACYAELPGVSICQLQRREGVDAVFVSRWHWDGRAKRREDDPDRRFAPA